MTADEFKALALAHLGQCDEADREAWATEQPDADWFAEAHSRWLHARQAFPGMDWEEFSEADYRRKPQKARGRRKKGLAARSTTPIARAARDSERIEALAARMSYSFEGAEADHIDIAAERHGVDPVDSAERLRRGASRNPHRAGGQRR